MRPALRRWERYGVTVAVNLAVSLFDRVIEFLFRLTPVTFTVVGSAGIVTVFLSVYVFPFSFTVPTYSVFPATPGFAAVVVFLIVAVSVFVSLHFVQVNFAVATV